MEEYMELNMVKENMMERPPLGLRWVTAGVGLCVVAALVLLAAGSRLPAPAGLDAPPHTFSAARAHAHLVSLASIGPRVAGSYENEVVAVRVVLAALRDIAAGAAPHHRLELDLHTASGAFSLSFLDGMNNVYRDVQSVVARLSAAGGRPAPRARRSAVLINCHFDTVPDSPGGSDDAAGCAVGLEALRALAAGAAPLPHDVVLLLNGAEENVMQGSHAFVSRHVWARSVRVFVNVEACGAGGREVLFQAGPSEPWLLEVYAAAVPRPFASSLAQELFDSKLIPADTDFRIFRDFGNLSGVDLAWSSNGYVYHTRLDTAERAPPAALQRTGDNVLALLRGLVASEQLARAPERAAGPPVFFDVLGACVVCLRPRAAAAAAAGALLAAAARLQLHAADAHNQLYISRGAWWRLVGGALAAQAAGALAGVGAAAAAGGLLHALGARLTFYSTPALLAPLYVAPALAVSWLVTLRLWARGGAAGAGRVVRGWARARLAADAVCAGWALALALCAACALRSGFLPALWVAGGAAAALLARVAGARRGAELAGWAAGCALPALQTGYVALDTLALLVPLAGRAGPGPLDALLGALAGALALGAGSALLPALAASRRPERLARALLALWALAALLVLTPLAAPYSALRPQRLMLFHTRRTDHVTNTTDTFFWTPDLDPNSPHSLDAYVPELRLARPTSAAECARWVYCGAPYYLPALGVVPSGHWAPAAAPPSARLRVALRLRAGPAPGAAALLLTAEGPAHVVLVLAPAPGVRLVRYEAPGAGGGAPREARRWAGRRTYFFTLHDARQPAPWHLRFQFEHSLESQPEYWADVSAAGHSQFGEHKEAPALRALLAALPPHAAPGATGWGVDLHLYRV